MNGSIQNNQSVGYKPKERATHGVVQIWTVV